MAHAIENRLGVASDPRKYLTQMAIVFAAQFAVGKIGDVLQAVNRGGIGPVWPASGIALAALLICGYSVWPGVAAGAFLLVFLSPLPHWAAIVYAGGTTLAAVVGAFLLERTGGFDRSLSHLRDALSLIIFGAFGSSMVGASIGAPILYAAHIHGWSGLGSAWLIYWLGDSTGVLLVTPFVLTFPTLIRIRDRDRVTELVLLLLLLTVASFVVFGDLPLIPVRLHVLAFAVLPFVMWAAVRFGVSVTALCILITATIATAETALGSGPFTTNTPFMNAVLLDVYFAVISATGLILSALSAEKEQSEREREQTVREQAAMEARLRLAAIVESSDDAIFGVDANGIITEWNAGAERLYGYSPAEVIGKSISLLAPPGSSADFAAMIAQRRTISHDTAYQRKDGTQIDMSITMSPIRDTQNRLIGFSIIGRNVSERRRQEAILRESEEKLREYERAVEGSEEMIAVVDRQYRYLIANRKFLKMRKMTKERVVGHFAQEVLNEGVFEAKVKKKLDEAFEGNVVRYEMKYTYPDLGERDVLTSYFPIEGSARLDRVACIIQDVTERKRTEEALRNSEERFRLAAQAGKMYAYEWDVATDSVVRSEEHINVLGFGDPAWQPTRQQLLATVHPDDRALYISSIDQLTPEKPTTQICYRMLGPDGLVLWLEKSSRGFFDERGRLLRVVGMVADITDRKLAEAALAIVSRRLIEAQEQERSRIARELHDDIGQRLALLIIEVEQLQQNSGDLPAQFRSRMSKLKNQASEIAVDIQSLSHELHSSKLQYLGIAAAIAGFCRDFGEQQNVDIDFNTHHLPSPLPSDISLCLFRVLQEALHNSAKHSGTRHFKVRLWGTSDGIHLTVSDSGVGFDVKSAAKGRGLGLTSMQERVRLMNGTIMIDSKPMAGTSIHVSVPFTSERSSERAAG